jgi:segregation and condensation protein A
MSYIVRAGDFEGPFDLLLHLIAREKVDLWQVSLSAITEAYLAEVKRMQALDLEVATEFLVIAATLIELKAVRLLPGDDGDSELEALLEERDLLFARLLQYQAYKQVGAQIGARLEAAARFRPRTVGPDEQLPAAVGNLLEGVTPVDVARLAARALTPQAAPPPAQGAHIAPPPALSLAEAVGAVRARLEEVRETTLDALLGPGALPVEVVVHFLAVLELYKRSLADVTQPHAFATIRLRWSGEEEAAGAAEEGWGDAVDAEGAPQESDAGGVWHDATGDEGGSRQDG